MTSFPSITVPSGYCWSEHSIHNVDTRVLWSLISISCWRLFECATHTYFLCQIVAGVYFFGYMTGSTLVMWFNRRDSSVVIECMTHRHYILRVSHQCAGRQTAYNCWTRAHDHVSHVWRHATMQMSREFPARNDIWAIRWSCRSPRS